MTCVVASASAISAVSASIRADGLPSSSPILKVPRVAAHNHAGCHHVGAEVDAGLDNPAWPGRGGQRGRGQPVLQRGDECPSRQSAGEQLGGSGRVVLLAGHQDREVDPGGQLARSDRGRASGELLDRPLDAQPVGLDRAYHRRVGVADQDVVAVSDESGRDGPADCPAAKH
jgi:hypothetical protein